MKQQSISGAAGELCALVLQVFTLVAFLEFRTFLTRIHQQPWQPMGCVKNDKSVKQQSISGAAGELCALVLQVFTFVAFLEFRTFLTRIHQQPCQPMGCVKSHKTVKEPNPFEAAT